MMIAIHAILNKEIESQNVFMLKCARGSISNQNRQEITTPIGCWGGRGGCVVSYWGVTGGWVVSQKGCVYRRSL